MVKWHPPVFPTATLMRPVTQISMLNSTTSRLRPSSFLSERGSSPVTPGTPVKYRIEERRRTIYVTSDTPPTGRDIDEIFGDIPERPMSAPIDSRRQSVIVREVHVVDDPSGQAASPSNYLVAAHDLRSPTNAKISDNMHTPPESPAKYRGSPRTPIRHRILFYNRCDPHYGFTNFSPHPVLYAGRKYPTSEHLFQSFKFQGHRPNLAEHIRTCSEWPSIAFKEARRFQPEVRHDWKQVNIEKMDETLWHKFTQHRDLREELLATGDAELVEDSDKDAFWGIGADGLGRNELGKALERLRTKLRGE